MPVLFGGDDPTPLGESASEKQLHAFVAAAREAHSALVALAVSREVGP